jgi:hypothetical protein
VECERSHHLVYESATLEQADARSSTDRDVHGVMEQPLTAALNL